MSANSIFIEVLSNRLKTKIFEIAWIIIIWGFSYLLIFNLFYGGLFFDDYRQILKTQNPTNKAPDDMKSLSDEFLKNYVFPM